MQDPGPEVPQQLTQQPDQEVEQEGNQRASNTTPRRFRDTVTKAMHSLYGMTGAKRLGVIFKRGRHPRGANSSSVQIVSVSRSTPVPYFRPGGHYVSDLVDDEHFEWAHFYGTAAQDPRGFRMENPYGLAGFTVFMVKHENLVRYVKVTVSSQYHERGLMIQSRGIIHSLYSPVGDEPAVAARLKELILRMRDDLAHYNQTAIERLAGRLYG